MEAKEPLVEAAAELVEAVVTEECMDVAVVATTEVMQATMLAKPGGRRTMKSLRWMLLKMKTKSGLISSTHNTEFF